MPLIGKGDNTSLTNFRILDDISNDFDGIKTIFPLKESSKLITIHTIGATFISVNNILLTPKKDQEI